MRNRRAVVAVAGREAHKKRAPRAAVSSASRLASNPRASPVNSSQDGICILDVRGFNPRLPRFHYKSQLLDESHDLVVGELEASRIGDSRRVVVVVLPITVVVTAVITWRLVLEMPQQGPDVYEDATGLQAVEDGLEVADEVRGRVEEEDGGDDVIGVPVVFVAVEAEEVGGAHGHVAGAWGAGELGGRVDVGHLVAAEVILPGQMVGEGVYPGIDGVLAGALGAVEDVGGGEELMVGDFVALGVEAHAAQLEDEPAQARAGDEDFEWEGLGVLGEAAAPLPLLLSGAENGAETGGTFGGALGGPVAEELTDGAAGFVDVGVFGDAGPFAGHGGLLRVVGGGPPGASHVEGPEAVDGDGTGQLGIGVYGIVRLIQGLQEIEWWLGEHLPMGLG